MIRVLLCALFITAPLCSMETDPTGPAQEIRTLAGSLTNLASAVSASKSSTAKGAADGSSSSASPQTQPPDYQKLLGQYFTNANKFLLKAKEVIDKKSSLQSYEKDEYIPWLESANLIYTQLKELTSFESITFDSTLINSIQTTIQFFNKLEQDLNFVIMIEDTICGGDSSNPTDDFDRNIQIWETFKRNTKELLGRLLQVKPELKVEKIDLTDMQKEKNVQQYAQNFYEFMLNPLNKIKKGLSPKYITYRFETLKNRYDTFIKDEDISFQDVIISSDFKKNVKELLKLNVLPYPGADKTTVKQSVWDEFMEIQKEFLNKLGV